MLEFLSNIANAIFTVFQLLLNMVRGLVSFFLMIPQFMKILVLSKFLRIVFFLWMKSV